MSEQLFGHGSNLGYEITRQQFREITLATKDHFQARLESRGVPFVYRPPEDPHFDMLPEETDEHYVHRISQETERYIAQERTMRTVLLNEAEVIQLAALRYKDDFLRANEYPETASHHKKIIQAGMVLKDYDEPWIELVDQEFPGQGLTLVDAEYLQDATAVKQLQTEAEAIQSAGLDRARMMLIQGGAKYGPSEEIMLRQLQTAAMQYTSYSKLPNQRTYLRSLMEDVRQQIIATDNIQLWMDVYYSFTDRSTDQ